VCEQLLLRVSAVAAFNFSRWRHCTGSAVDLDTAQQALSVRISKAEKLVPAAYDRVKRFAAHGIEVEGGKVVWGDEWLRRLADSGTTEAFYSGIPATVPLTSSHIPAALSYVVLQSSCVTPRDVQQYCLIVFSMCV
jgi:hypothetical protein